MRGSYRPRLATERGGGLVVSGGYVVSYPNRPAVNRPTKAAAGMSLATRCNAPDALRLLVFGTLDSLRRTARTEPVPCPCCGAPGRKLRLTNAGRQRLDFLRLRRAGKE